MTCRGSFVLLLLSTALVAGGCSAPDSTESIALGAYAGPVFVEIDTFAGNVTVTANPKLESGTVSVTRQALHGRERKEEAAASLEQIGVETDFGDDVIGWLLRVNATTQHAEPYNQRAHINVELPRVDGLRVRTTEGQVTAHGVQGEVDIETLGGQVTVITREPLTEAITLVTHGGDIILRMRPESSGRFDAEAERGEVRHRFKLGRVLITEVTHNLLHATYNDGLNPVLLRAYDGDVKIAVDEAPERIGRFVIQ